MKLKKGYAENGKESDWRREKCQNWRSSHRCEYLFIYNIHKKISWFNSDLTLIVELEKMRGHADRSASAGHQGHLGRWDASFGVRLRDHNQPVDFVRRRAHVGPRLVHGHERSGHDANAGEEGQDHCVHDSSAVEWDFRDVRQAVSDGRGTSSLHWLADSSSWFFQQVYILIFFVALL